MAVKKPSSIRSRLTTVLASGAMGAFRLCSSRGLARVFWCVFPTTPLPQEQQRLALEQWTEYRMESEV
jgi:hypothetical protein